MPRPLAPPAFTVLPRPRPQAKRAKSLKEHACKLCKDVFATAGGLKRHLTKRKKHEKERMENTRAYRSALKVTVHRHTFAKRSKASRRGKKAARKRAAEAETEEDEDEAFYTDVEEEEEEEAA